MRAIFHLPEVRGGALSLCVELLLEHGMGRSQGGQVGIQAGDPLDINVPRGSSCLHRKEGPLQSEDCHGQITGPPVVRGDKDAPVK